MKLQSLYIRNFRNLKEASLTFGDKINLFYGLNAQGKTNLLEAIILLSTGRSFRTQHLSELIHETSSFFFLEADMMRDRVSQRICLSFDGKTKQVECNATRSSSFQPLLGHLPSILYAPNDLDLIGGSPSLRRRFLNLHLAQSDPLYIHHFFRFWRALKQRNHLLRNSVQESIECWEQEMAFSASYLFTQRSTLLKELNEVLKESCQLLSSEALQIHYLPSQPIDPPLVDSYLAQLQRNRNREKQLGLTLTGPHRDDFSLSLEQKPARLYASEGQKRTAIAALRLAEWRRLRQKIEAPPLFAIDDFELHLDRERKTLFCQALEELGQVFITTPDTHPNWPQATLLKIHAGLATPCP